MQTERIEVGTRVRFTKGPLGGGTRFQQTAYKGDEGTYLAKHPSVDLEDWHRVMCEKNGERFEVPVHRSQFEVIGGES